MNPAVMLLSLSIWGKLLGLLGLIIALPVTCVLWAFYQQALAASQRREGKRSEKPVK